MDDNTIEIRNSETNVEEIMAKIRENIRRRQAAGELPPDSDSVIGSHSLNCISGETSNIIQSDLSYIRLNWDIHNNSYFISSHHPYLGRFLIKGRQIVHGEVRRYVDPIVHKQTVFNQSTEHVLHYLAQKEKELDEKISNAVKERDAFISKINTKLENTTNELKNSTQELEKTAQELEDTIQKQENQIQELEKTAQELEDTIQKQENQIQELEKTAQELENQIYEDVQNALIAINTDIDKKAWLAQVLKERVQNGLVQKRAPLVSISKENMNYFLFEERFRGSREEIKKRQLAFLSYFEKCARVLDIGSGRGEFLEILKDHNIGGIGVDSDPDMVAYCRSRQLVVEQSDAIAYLETLEDNSLDGIFIDQVVEHLEPEYLIRLLGLCYKKLNKGYYIIVETVNPLSLVAFFNFYLDMSHQKPVHPYTLKFLLESSQYREIELKYYSEIPEKAKLQKINQCDSCTENERQFLGNYNYNIDLLNLLLWGPMDFAAIGKK
jgi:SAM-dependent methyltransferase